MTAWESGARRARKERAGVVNCMLVSLNATEDISTGFYDDKRALEDLIDEMGCDEGVKEVEGLQVEALILASIVRLYATSSTRMSANRIAAAQILRTAAWSLQAIRTPGHVIFD